MHFIFCNIFIFLNILFYFILFVKNVYSLPINDQNRKQTRSKRAPIYDIAQSYLTKFGYLPQSDLETGNLRTDDQLKDAVRTLQKFGNIPETGIIDEETEALMKQPRCGLPDVSNMNRRRKRYTLHGQRWQYNNLTWSLRSRALRNLDHGTVRAELTQALSIWEKNSKLTFKEINSDSADILVYFERGYHGDGFPFDGKGQILAHAFFPGPGRGGDAHFDDEELWLMNGEDKKEGTNLMAVAAHEFGHSLGLAHSSVYGALMYPWYQGLKPDFELPDDDKYAIQILYGKKDQGTKLWGKIPETPKVKPTPRDPYVPAKPPPRDPYGGVKPPIYVPPKIKPKTTVKPRIWPTKPDTCDTTYDAISVIRKDTFIFKDKYIWRIGDKGLYEGYPALIDRLWYNLPSDFTNVDAVYERHDGKIVFFIGKEIYLFNGNVLVPGYPKPLTSIGLKEDVDHIDAAMVWSHNGHTYLFSGWNYWKLDEEAGHIEYDYPRDISMWRGIGHNIDAAFQWKDGATYFFKGKGFWKFNDMKMRVENVQPIPSAPFWMGCNNIVESPYTELNSTEYERTEIFKSSSTSLFKVHSLFLFTTISSLFLSFSLRPFLFS